MAKHKPAGADGKTVTKKKSGSDSPMNYDPENSNPSGGGSPSYAGRDFMGDNNQGPNKPPQPGNDKFFS